MCVLGFFFPFLNNKQALLTGTKDFVTLGESRFSCRSSFMYLDLIFLSRRPTMVIMEVPTIDCASLHGLLEGDVPDCLVLDCRSFLSFNSSHIPGSYNVRFSTIVRRRARGGLGLEHIVPNEDTRNRLLCGDYQSVVLLDDRSSDLSQAKKDGTLMLAVTALCRDRCGADVFILKGKIKEKKRKVAHSAKYPGTSVSLYPNNRTTNADYSCHHTSWCSSKQCSKITPMSSCHLFGDTRINVDLSLLCLSRCPDLFSPFYPSCPGGFETFCAEYPEMCTKPSPPQGLSLPLSSSHPGSADPSCSPCNTPLYDQVCFIFK